MMSLFAQIGFDPQIRGALVVAVGAIVLFGSVWMILATNQGVRLAALVSFAGFFGWMVIMGGFWWVRGIGYVGDSVSWEVLDYNRGDISASTVERATTLPPPDSIQGLGFVVAQQGLADGVEEMGEFLVVPDASDPAFADLSAEEFASEVERARLRSESTTLSQLMTVAPAYIEESTAQAPGEDALIPYLDGWRVMTAGEAGEAQAAVGAGILEIDAFDFESQNEFKFLEAYNIGGKPTIDRENDLDCTFCVDNLERGWLWISNSARIKNPIEYSVVQLRAIDEEALITEEGQAPRFPAVDEDAPIISVVLVRDLGNLRFPPAMVTLGSLLIFTALCFMLHLRDKATMRRIDEFAESV